MRYSDLVGSRLSRRPPHGWAGWRVVLAVTAALISGCLLYTLFAVRTVVREVAEPPPPELAPEMRPAVRQPGQRTNILVIGLDAGHRNADLLLLLSIDEALGQIALLQLPRETRVAIAGQGAFDQLGTAHSAGVGDDRFPANMRALKTVEGLLAVPVHEVITVEPEGLIKLVDQLGGIQVTVPVAMDYDEPVQNRQIHLAPGAQKLHGEQALAFIRWRHNTDGGGHPDGEPGRMRMQQAFLQTLIHQLVRPRNLPRLPGLAMRLAPHVHATSEPARLIALARLALTVRTEGVAAAILPGTDAPVAQPGQQGRLSFYLPDPDAADRLVDRLIRGIDPAEAAAIRVEVAASDQRARDLRATARLAAQGFVVSTTAPPVALPAITRVIDLRGDGASARLVGRSVTAQGMAIELLSQPDPRATADVRVIFGGPH